MNVLSLFDGISCGMIALERAGVKVDKYYASEIDKYAIKVSEANYPNIERLGDVKTVKASNLAKIDLLIGGSPCQGFSFAGKQLNFGDPRSQLFFEFVRILKECQAVNPDVKFMLENVKMKKEYQDIISNLLGVEPIEINSALVSAQNRKRLYWSNIENVKQPEDKGILLKDILISESNEVYQRGRGNNPGGIKINKSPCMGSSSWQENVKVVVREKSKCLRVGGRNSPFESKQEFDSPFKRVNKKGKIKPGIKKAFCLTGGGNSRGNHSDMDLIQTNYKTRRYTPIECERLQTVPDNYTNHVSNTQRYKMLGNGWTIDVISHIFKNLNKEF